MKDYLADSEGNRESLQFLINYIFIERGIRKEFPFFIELSCVVVWVNVKFYVKFVLPIRYDKRYHPK